MKLHDPAKVVHRETDAGVIFLLTALTHTRLTTFASSAEG